MERLRIFIVEDDETIAGGISAALSAWGYETRLAADFLSVDDEARAYAPDMVLLDISLPYYNGFYWCQKLRAHSRVPIMFISSHTQSMDIVMAINMGGDDYITKPFSMDVLVAKTGALLRRARPDTAQEPARIRDAALCPQRGCLTRGDTAIELTKNELRILQTLLSHKGEVVSRADIMLALWDSDSFIDDNTLTVNMNRLRKKLAEHGLDGCITTRKGEGYRIDD